MIMSKSMFALAMTLASTCATSGVAQEAYGTPAEARAMVERAAAALKDNETNALKAFNNKDDKDFHYGDLFVFCINVADAKFTANVNPDLIGLDVRTLEKKDNPFGVRIYDVINNTPEGRIVVVGYEAPRPGTTLPVPKVSYVTRVGNQGCGVGFFQ